LKKKNHPTQLEKYFAIATSSSNFRCFYNALGAFGPKTKSLC